MFQPDYDENEENKPKSFFRAFGSKDKARKKYGESATLQLYFEVN